MENSGIALFCAIYPSSGEKQARVLDLLRNLARKYYRTEEAQCTTWTYFTPYPASTTTDSQPLIGGLEIYTDKTALTKQLKDPVYFQPYHAAVKKEQLYRKEEDLVAWYFAAGFIAREDHALPFGSGNLISQTKFVGERDGVLKAIESFVPFVKDKEPGVLTYAAFTRPKAPKEVLLFVRYKDSKAMQSHSRAPEHDDAVKEIMKHVENDIAKSTTLWREVDDSFVSKQVGGTSLTSSRL